MQIVADFLYQKLQACMNEDILYMLPTQYDDSRNPLDIDFFRGVAWEKYIRNEGKRQNIILKIFSLGVLPPLPTPSFLR